MEIKKAKTVYSYSYLRTYIHTYIKWSFVENPVYRILPSEIKLVITQELVRLGVMNRTSSSMVASTGRCARLDLIL